VNFRNLAHDADVAAGLEDVVAYRNRTRREFMADSTRSVLGAGAAFSASSWAAVQGAGDRIRLGVIGIGSRGAAIMRQFREEPNIDVVALCDCYETALRQALQNIQGKAKTYSDYRALLDDKEVDCVLIATPDQWHKQMAVDACRAGKDIYIEKPLTYTIEEGHEIIDAVKGSKRVLQVGLQQRSGEHYIEARRDYIEKGRLGKITLARTWWHGNSFHLRKPDFTEKPAGLDWKAFLGPLPYREFNAHQFYNWRAYLDFGGGQITDLFTHWIDVVHWYLGDDLPAAANAAGGIYQYKDGRTAPDTICLQLEYPREWVATFEATLVPGARGAGIELLGTEGRLEINRGGFTFQARRSAEPEIRKNTSSLEKLHVQNFIACMRSRRLPNSDVVSGHRSALASHLGKIAYLKKQRITFDPESERRHTLM
jgi:predicted dehydrogenase